MQVLEKLDFNNSTIQHIVLASIPPQQPPASTPEVHCSDLPCIRVDLTCSMSCASCLIRTTTPEQVYSGIVGFRSGLLATLAQVTYQGDRMGECELVWYGVQPASPLQKMQEAGEEWLLGAALLQRPHLVVIQQLLIKGLFNQDSQLVTVQVPHLIPRACVAGTSFSFQHQPQAKRAKLGTEPHAAVAAKTTTLCRKFGVFWHLVCVNGTLQRGRNRAA